MNDRTLPGDIKTFDADSEKIQTEDAREPAPETASTDTPKDSTRKPIIRVNDLIFILAGGILAGLSYLLPTQMELAPGVQYRLCAFVAPSLGIILGKYRGGVAAAIGEAVWVYVSVFVMDIPVLSVATPFALVGNFFQAYIPGLMVEKLGDDGGWAISAKNAGLILGGAILGLGVLTFFWFGVFFQVLGVALYMDIVKMLLYSDFPPMVIGTVPFTWFVLRCPGIKDVVFKDRW